MRSLRRMTYFMRPYRWVIIIGFFTVIMPVLMELVVPRVLQFVIDDGIEAGNMDAIFQGALVIFGAALAGAIATLGQGVCRARLSQGMAFDMRNALFSHIQSLSFANLDRMQTGWLMTRVSSDVDVVRMFSSAGLALILRAVLMILGSVVMIVLTDWQLSLVMFAFLAVAAGIIYGFMRAAQPLFAVVQQKLSELNTLVQENLSGVQVVKAFVREQFEIDRFEASNLDYMDQNIKVGRLLALVMPIMTVLTNVGTVAVIWLGGMDVIGGRLSVGELIAFNNYLMIGMTPLLLLGNMLTMASRAEASAARVLELLDTQPRIQGKPSGKTDRLQGHVVFEHVSFRYDGGEKSVPVGGSDGRESPRLDRSDVLDGVCFEAKPGQKLALFGATGSGKSTLVHLIMRFYDATGGQVLLDGVNVQQWDLGTLRAQIGTVMQQTMLFSGTVGENIAYGRPGASLEDVVAAAKDAQAHDFIMAMPDGYDSSVEPRGANLSGGQKQRIAIARALLTAPGILIFDDSTSAVDLDTETQIQEALDARLADTTIFIVAQRISSVLTADQIIVLDAGQIADRGTHHELLQTSPIYRDICRSQFGNQFGQDALRIMGN